MPVELTFGKNGLLAPGDHALTLRELRRSLLVAGPDNKALYPNWDARWRRHLVDNLEVLVIQLLHVGITEIFIDGSFAEDKEHPNDIDGYFECDLMRFATGRLERELNLLDPHKIWTWDQASRRSHPGFPHSQLPMWHRYRVELYPHTPGACSGLKDTHGNDLEFPSAFRLSRRDNKRRGIIKVVR
jgi:uncharacterized protein DUF6932